MVIVVRIRISVVLMLFVVGLLVVLMNRRMNRMKRNVGRENKFRVNWVCLFLIRSSIILGIAKNIVNRNRVNLAIICFDIFIVFLLFFI